MQKRSQDTYREKDRAEPDGYPGEQTSLWITENNITNTDNPASGLMEQILSPQNVSRAYKKVKQNKGSGGIDKMEVGSLKSYFVEHRNELIQSIQDGKYRPNPVLQVEIPKDNGKKRKLGIPTVIDRVVQQAITQVLSPIFEKQFSESSYGFRRGRNAHQALKKCIDYANSGYEYAVDIDLEKYFDSVNHSKLIQILSNTIKDGRVISLIHKYLNAGVVVNHKFEANELGVAQGGNLSPLLSNIMLNELDQELERRGHRFIRYADDIVILCKSKRSAERTLISTVRYLKEKLFLSINEEKTVVDWVAKIQFLGYSFYRRDDRYKLRLAPKSRKKLKKRMKELTSRSKGWGYKTLKRKLGEFIRGWVNYFKLAEMKSLMNNIDGWYRSRLRMLIWHNWKRVRTRFKNLKKLGLNQHYSYVYANTRKGYWRIAHSRILTGTLKNEVLRKAGYTFFSDYYRKVRLSI